MFWPPKPLLTNSIAVNNPATPAPTIPILIQISFLRLALHGKWVGQECANHGDEQTQTPGVHYQQEQLATKHSAPGTEDVGGVLRCTGGKRHWCRID